MQAREWYEAIMTVYELGRHVRGNGASVLGMDNAVVASNGASRDRRRRTTRHGKPWSGCSAAEIEVAALAQLGREKNKALSNAKELRLGSKGSIAVRLTGAKAGAWYDHDNNTGDYLKRNDDAEGKARTSRRKATTNPSVDECRAGLEPDGHGLEDGRSPNSSTLPRRPSPAMVMTQRVTLVPRPPMPLGRRRSRRHARSGSTCSASSTEPAHSRARRAKPT
jgi:hypothetical protein